MAEPAGDEHAKSAHTSADDNVVANIKLPPYWPQDPLVWFAQVEAQFTNHRITKETSRYAHVVASLSPDIAQEVRDLLITKPDTKPYSTLKAALVARTSESEQRRLQQLLTEEELGDRKPTQLLRRMRQLLGERVLEDSILRQLFVQRMPTNVQQILASSSETLSITQVAELADRIIAVAAPGFVTAVAAPAPHPSTTTSIQRLHDEVQRLTIQVESLSKQLRGRSRSRGRGWSTNRQGQHQEQRGNQAPSSAADNDECWFHRTFGENARRCRPPCRRQSSSDAPPPSSTDQGNEKASG